MKMKTPEMSVVRFDMEDVIATSGDPTNWSPLSYVARDLNDLWEEQRWAVARSNDMSHGHSLDGDKYDGTYNYLDGNKAGDARGEIFAQDGTHYHYDYDSYIGIGMSTPIYSNWKTCTDPSHYFANSGK